MFFFNFFFVVDRDFASSVLYRGTVGSRHMEYLPGMFLTASEKDGNALVSEKMSLLTANIYFGKGLHL